MLKTAVAIAAASSAALVAAHGTVSDWEMDNTWYTGYNPYTDPYLSPAPERITWEFPSAGNGPVQDVTTSDITCNKGGVDNPANISATVAAGDDINIYWTTWPSSHKGPVMTYLASCDGDCSSSDPTALEFFKINAEGLYSDGTWATDKLIANNNSWTVTVPSSIAAGNYILRHEILALHSAGTSGGAQFYPSCSNLKVTGGGSATVPSDDLVKFPGAYSASDPGILVNIYSSLTSYTIPGPAVFGSSSSSSSSGSASSGSASSAAATTAAATTAAATSAAETSAAAATTSAAATSAAETSAAETSAAATSSIASPSAIASASAVAEAVTTSQAATTFATSTKAAATTAAAAATSAASSSSTSSDEAINQCLDEVNSCIAKAQGDSSAMSACADKRTACYSS